MSTLLQALSLARKAGKVACGSYSCAEALQRRKARLVLIAADASENTKKEFIDACNYRHVPYVITDAGKEQLAGAVGMQERVVIAVLDDGFANLIQNS